MMPSRSDSALALAITVATFGAIGYFAFRSSGKSKSAPRIPGTPIVIDEGVGAGGVPWRVVTYPSADVPATLIQTYGTGESGYISQVFHDGRWKWLQPPYVLPNHSRDLAIAYLQRVADGIVGFDLLKE